MSNKLKALSLGLVAMLAMGVFGALSATADPTNPHRGGHFVSDAPSKVTKVTGSEKPGTAHNLLFSVEGGKAIDCTVSHYEGTATGETVEEIEVAPDYKECDTQPFEGAHDVDVTENGCKFNFTVNTAPTTTHNAVQITGCTQISHGLKGIVVHHPNCTMVIPEQTVTGVTYDNVAPSGKHEVTLTSTVSTLNAHYVTGVCIFLGTNHTASMTGSATVQGFDSKSGEQVNVTAT
jgi:hypothetical protein